MDLNIDKLVTRPLPASLLSKINKCPTARELLKAWRKINTRKKWCKDTVARDKNNSPVDATSRKAVRFCAQGAMESICASFLAQDYLMNASIELHPDEFDHTGVNDHLGYAAVRKVFRLAILQALRGDLDNEY